MNRKDRNLNDRLIAGISHLSSILSQPKFIEPGDAAAILNGESQLISDATKRSRKFLYSFGLVNKELKSNLEKYQSCCASFLDGVDSHNERMAVERAAEIGKIINPVEGRNLDRQQLYSIALDLRTRLVLAGAGSGKTTTIVGFIKYLLASGMANPEDILALSFTNASVNELRKRIMVETGSRVEVATFHSTGLKIIASSDGKVPKVSKIDIREFISDEIRKKQSEPLFAKAMADYLAYDFNGLMDEQSFLSRAEYFHYLKENPLITLKGERVKSTGEADIANFLAMNGIPYEYESSYEVDTNDSKYGQYHPDFHLSGTNIYIEYFGIDHDGNVAKFMIDENPNASEEYRREIEWKRQIHVENHTHMVELYFHERSDGVMHDRLEANLRRLGVDFNPRPSEEIFEEMIRDDKWRFGSMVSSFATIITLMKSSGKSWGECYPGYNDRMGRKKADRLEQVLKPIYESYQKHLFDEGEIDFEDMLNMAADCIRNGKYHHPYKYVVVDEYQDLSHSRFNLLKSMREDKDYRLYCVGDDWQSIYRFNGSDVSYIIDFEKYWGPSAVCKIETTYRFNGELLRKSSEFISRNSRQHRKDLKGVGKSDCPVIPIVASNDVDMRRKIEDVLKSIPESATVLFLGRYNHDVTILEGKGMMWNPSIENSSITITYEGRRDLDMRFMTIHGSKGLQADYVISLNNRSGRYGFPSNRTEPAIIKMLLGGDDTLHDEERRLFYVAMTRARCATYIASYKDSQSSFFREIFDIEADRNLSYCPICRGRLVLRDGKYGKFMGCENYNTLGCKFTRKFEMKQQRGE